MLSMYIGKEVVGVKVFKFPAGESGVSFKAPSNTLSNNNTDITLDWESNDDIINLALLVDAVRRHYYGNVDIALTIPYFPYARQDRVCNTGESLSVKVMADIINSLNFTNVCVTDPHSEVLAAVLNNMVTVNIKYSISTAIAEVNHGSTMDAALVSPDAGASKKVLAYAKELGGMPVIRADKTRDTKTGNIVGTVVYSEHLGNTHLIVIDDIGDGMGTFIPLAAELRKITNGTVSLILSHGIFTKGVDILQGVFDNIYVINNMFGHHPLIKEI